MRGPSVMRSSSYWKTPNPPYQVRQLPQDKLRFLQIVRNLPRFRNWQRTQIPLFMREIRELKAFKRRHVEQLFRTSLRLPLIWPQRKELALGMRCRTTD